MNRALQTGLAGLLTLAVGTAVLAQQPPVDPKIQSKVRAHTRVVNGDVNPEQIPYGVAAEISLTKLNMGQGRYKLPPEGSAKAGTPKKPTMVSRPGDDIAGTVWETGFDNSKAKDLLNQKCSLLADQTAAGVFDATALAELSQRARDMEYEEKGKHIRDYVKTLSTAKQKEFDTYMSDLSGVTYVDTNSVSLSVEHPELVIDTTTIGCAARAYARSQKVEINR